MFDKGKKCPLLKKPCIQYSCQWFIQIQGTNPQTGVQSDEWGCAIAWLPILLIEGAQETRQTAAAIESFRNAVLQDQQVVLQMATKEMEELAYARDDDN